MESPFYGPQIWKPNVVPGVNVVRSFPDNVTVVPGMGYVRGTAVPTLRQTTYPQNYGAIPTSKNLLIIGGIVVLGIVVFMYLKKNKKFMFSSKWGDADTITGKEINKEEFGETPKLIEWNE